MMACALGALIVLQCHTYAMSTVRARSGALGTQESPLFAVDALLPCPPPTQSSPVHTRSLHIVYAVDRYAACDPNVQSP